jgi:hypothetical protein
MRNTALVARRTWPSRRLDDVATAGSKWKRYGVSPSHVIWGADTTRFRVRSDNALNPGRFTPVPSAVTRRSRDHDVNCTAKVPLPRENLIDSTPSVSLTGEALSPIYTPTIRSGSRSP